MQFILYGSIRFTNNSPAVIGVGGGRAIVPSGVLSWPVGMPARPATQPTGQPGKASQPGWPGGPAGLVWDHFGDQHAFLADNQMQYRNCSNRVVCKVTQNCQNGPATSPRVSISTLFQ